MCNCYDRSREEEIPEELLELLLSFSDFSTFKQLMLAHKEVYHWILTQHYAVLILHQTRHGHAGPAIEGRAMTLSLWALGYLLSTATYLLFRNDSYFQWICIMLHIAWMLLWVIDGLERSGKKRNWVWYIGYVLLLMYFTICECLGDPWIAKACVGLSICAEKIRNVRTSFDMTEMCGW